MVLQVRRLGYALGAEIGGLDLRERLDEATIASIRQAMLDYIVLCFPGQDMGPAELASFGRRFGELDDNRFIAHQRHPDDPAVMPLSNKPATIGGKSFGGGIAERWHTDLSFTNRPSTISFLTAKQLPEVGGDTMFANMYLGYETLSPAMQRLIEKLEGVHDVSLSSYFSKESAELQAERRRRNPPVVHPVVRVHAETGRKALYVSDRLRHFVGFTEEETQPILDFLNQHATRYEFTYRHRWRLGDLVTWDNRCTMHCAVKDYDLDQPRRMLRCSLFAPKAGYYYEERATAGNAR